MKLSKKQLRQKRSLSLFSTYRRIAQRSNFLKIVDNICWLFFDKILRMGVGGVVTVWFARYLGPEQFGLYNFTLSLVGLLSPLAMMGLAGIVVREIVKKPLLTNEFLGTSAVLHLMGGMVAFLAVITTIQVLRPNDSISKTAVAIAGLTLLFKFCSPIIYWFEAQVQSKYSVVAANSAFLLAAVAKITLILNEASLLSFLWIVLAESVFICVAMLAVYHWSGGRLTKWIFRIGQVRFLLQASWPLFLSGFAALIYMGIDKIMIGLILGDEAVGIYAAAVNVSQIWHFVPTVIIASVFPAILRAKERSLELYLQRLQTVFDVLVTLSLSLAIVFTFFTERIIALVYGADYQSAALVLAIHIWTGIFVAMSVTSYHWMLAEDRQILSLQRASLGALFNVVLNMSLIPVLGLSGAAIGTMLSYAFAALIFDLLQTETKPIFS